MHKLTPPKIIVTDETHHSRAKTYKDIYEYFPNALRVGFTATPWRANSKGFTDIYDEMVKGPSVEWLINNNKLADYDYKSVVLADESKLKSLAQVTSLKINRQCDTKRHIWRYRRKLSKICKRTKDHTLRPQC